MGTTDWGPDGGWSQDEGHGTFRLALPPWEPKRESEGMKDVVVRLCLGQGLWRWSIPIDMRHQKQREQDLLKVKDSGDTDGAYDRWTERITFMMIRMDTIGRIRTIDGTREEEVMDRGSRRGVS